MSFNFLYFYVYRYFISREERTKKRYNDRKDIFIFYFPRTCHLISIWRGACDLCIYRNNAINRRHNIIIIIILFYFFKTTTIYHKAKCMYKYLFQSTQKSIYSPIVIWDYWLLQPENSSSMLCALDSFLFYFFCSNFNTILFLVKKK